MVENQGTKELELEINLVNQTYIFSEQTDIAGGTITYPADGSTRNVGLLWKA